MRNLVIIGAGGYAKSVIDSIDMNKLSIYGFIDDYKETKEHLGYPILGKNLECINHLDNFVYFIAIGNNIKRLRWYNQLIERNLNIINIIDKSAIVSKEAVIGNGCFIGKMAIVNSKAVIGNNCIINTRALIEHGCNIGNHVNISTNTVLNGDVKINDLSFIGSCSVINGQLNIGKNVMVGSGAVVVRNIDDDCTAVGVPAKVIKRKGVRI